MQPETIPAPILQRLVGAPVEVAPSVELVGHVYVRAAQEPDGGYVVQLFVPIGDGGIHARFTGSMPSGWADRVAAIVREYNSAEVSGEGEPAGYYLPSGHYLPPPHFYPGAHEVGDLGSTIGGLLGGAVGTFLGGPAGTAIGGALGSAAGGAISGAVGGGDAPAQVDASGRPTWAPPAGSRANKARLLAQLGVTPGMPIADVVSRLETGTRSPWHRLDLEDAAAMLAIARTMSGNLSSVDALTDGTGASTAGTGPADASQATAAALAAMLGGAAPPGAVAPQLAAVQALQQALAFGRTPNGAAALGALSPDVLALFGDALQQVSLLARTMTGDPAALAVVDAAVQRASARTANAIALVRSMLGAFGSA